jgi:hypothetical protein
VADLPVTYVNASSNDGKRLSTRWWAEASPDLIAAAMVATARAIEASGQQRAREDAWLLHARLYNNAPISSLYHLGTRSATVPMRRQDEGPQHRINYNVVQSCVDTAAAKISKNKTRAEFLTSGGSYSQQQRAKQLTKYCDGIAHGLDLYEEGQRVFVDATGIFDTGVMKTYGDVSAGEAISERVLPSEVLVDDTDGLYGRPRSTYQRKHAPRDLVIDAFASRKTEEGRRIRDVIERTAPSDPLITGNATDIIAVYEGWHLPSGKNADDGVHYIATESGYVFNEPWKKRWHPFSAFRWNTRALGWWGQSLAEQLIGIQIEIGKLLRTIQRCQHLGSVLRILVEEGSEVIPSHLNNEIGALVKYRGTKPELWIGKSVPDDLFNQLDRLVAKAFEISGISQLSANSKKPEGLDAAVALREFHDIESERFVLVGQRFERFYIDVFSKIVEVSRDLYENRDDLRVRAPGTKLLEEIAWKDVNLEEDEYIMRPYPTSILPTTPAAKLQAVQELYGSQLLTDQSPAGVWARSLLDFPDMESYLSLEQSGLNDVQRLIGQIVEDGEYDPPDEFISPEMAITLAHNALLKGRNDKLPEARLELLRRFIQEAKDNAAALPQPAPAMPPPGMPPGAPGQPGPQLTPPVTSPALPSDMPVLPR